MFRFYETGSRLGAVYAGPLRIKRTTMKAEVWAAALLLGAMAGSHVGRAQDAGQISGTGTAAKRPMTFDDLMKMRRLGDIDVSRDGKWVLFSATDVDLKKNTKTSHLWIV